MLTGANLTGATWNTGFDSVVRSVGETPGVSLRDAGGPKASVTHASSLIGHPAPFYFLPYYCSTTDEDFDARLYNDPQAKRRLYWFAPHHMRSGRKIQEQIDEAIRVYGRLPLSHDADPRRVSRAVPDPAGAA